MNKSKKGKSVIAIIVALIIVVIFGIVLSNLDAIKDIFEKKEPPSEEWLMEHVPSDALLYSFEANDYEFNVKDVEIIELLKREEQDIYVQTVRVYMDDENFERVCEYKIYTENMDDEKYNILATTNVSYISFMAKEELLKKIENEHNKKGGYYYSNPVFTYDDETDIAKIDYDINDEYNFATIVGTGTYDIEFSFKDDSYSYKIDNEEKEEEVVWGSFEGTYKGQLLRDTFINEESVDFTMTVEKAKEQPDPEYVNYICKGSGIINGKTVTGSIEYKHPVKTVIDYINWEYILREDLNCILDLEYDYKFHISSSLGSVDKVGNYYVDLKFTKDVIEVENFLDKDIELEKMN